MAKSRFAERVFRILTERWMAKQICWGYNEVFSDSRYGGTGGVG